ncbi:MAG: sulfurtransferase TusA family protein [Alphaproteobacteria bacterium]
MNDSNNSVLDARGLRCPLPVLKTRKQLTYIPEGAILTVLATDPAVYLDMTHFCQTSGHIIETWHKDGDVFTFRIRKGPSIQKENRA